jgi:formylglycine-generating enzyme required for sulfatase activity
MRALLSRPTARLKAARFVRHAARWLDRQPLPLVVVAGVVLGLGLGLPGLLYLQSPVWVLLWGALLAVLWRLGHDAEPVFEEKNPVAARPQRVRDGLLVMMELPGGSFLMGSPDTDDMAYDDEKPQHRVTVAGFRIAVTPVTAGIYHEVMQREAPAESAARLPVIDVNWEDAIRFCNRLSEREGLRPAYRVKGESVAWDRFASGYRLPTEAEWEYACRAGTTTRFSFGDDPARLDAYAWFADNTSYRLQPVASKRPNPWGLYDMHGNVWEWCWDWYRRYALKQVRSWADLRNFARPRYRVVRGGSFDDAPENLRSARRGDVLPEARVRRGGFRCVRVPPRLLD